MWVAPDHTEIGWAMITVAAAGTIGLGWHHFREKLERLWQPGNLIRMLALTVMCVCGAGFVTSAAIYFWPKQPDHVQPPTEQKPATVATTTPTLPSSPAPAVAAPQITSPPVVVPIQHYDAEEASQLFRALKRLEPVMNNLSTVLTAAEGRFLQYNQPMSLITPVMPEELGNPGTLNREQKVKEWYERAIQYRDNEVKLLQDALNTASNEAKQISTDFPLYISEVDSFFKVANTPNELRAAVGQYRGNLSDFQRTNMMNWRTHLQNDNEKIGNYHFCIIEARCGRRQPTGRRSGNRDYGGDVQSGLPCRLRERAALQRTLRQRI